ncbi:MAG: ankyrin repeat domain-containing protein [Desulfomonilaceae bacterium]
MKRIGFVWAVLVVVMALPLAVWGADSASAVAPLQTLCAACSEGDFAAARAILPSVKNLNGECKTPPEHVGISPLCLAAKRIQPAIVRMLLSRHADPNFAITINGDFKTFPPVLWVARAHSGNFAGEKDVIEALLWAGADIDQTDEMGETALICAAADGDLPLVLYLLKNHANINATTKYEHRTALYYARKGAHLETVRALMDLGAK